MFLLVIALFGSALGQDSTFHNTGTVYWKDCGVGTKWVSFNYFNLSPSPIKLPGKLTLTVDGAINHPLTNMVALNVTMEKYVLIRYAKVPCGQFGLGSCYYTDPCRFLNTFKTSGQCPLSLVANGLSCACPFDPKVLHVPAASFSISEAQSPLPTQGKYRMRIEVLERGTEQLRGCLDTYFSVQGH